MESHGTIGAHGQGGFRLRMKVPSPRTRDICTGTLCEGVGGVGKILESAGTPRMQCDRERALRRAGSVAESAWKPTCESFTFTQRAHRVPMRDTFMLRPKCNVSVSAN